MHKKISIGASVILMLLAALVAFQITYLSVNAKYENKLNSLNTSVNSYDKLSYVDNLFRSLYVNEIDEKKLTDGIISGYVYGTGDKYAHYFTKEQFSEVMSDTEGEMQGIGVHVVFNTDYSVIEVVNVMPDSPALEAGIMPGDLIMNVGEEKEDVVTLGYYAAVNKLKGAAGTNAVFEVRRGDTYEKELSFSIPRGYISEQTVMNHIYSLDSTVGIIKITSFDKKTPEQFFEAVNELTGSGVTRLIIDIRYNPGGELGAITSVLDYLLPEGPIIRMIDRSGKETSMSSDAKYLDIPMAVIINESTASAGELFASALKDYDKATLVGTVTYGKGTMQQILGLPDGSGLSVSHQMYNPPFSENYEGVGVIPHIEVALDEALAEKNIYKITDEEDNQLHAAVKALNDIGA